MAKICSPDLPLQFKKKNKLFIILRISRAIVNSLPVFSSAFSLEPIDSFVFPP